MALRDRRQSVHVAAEDQELARRVRARWLHRNRQSGAADQLPRTCLRGLMLVEKAGAVAHAAAGWLYALSLRRRVRTVERASSPGSVLGDVSFTHAARRWLSPP